GPIHGRYQDPSTTGTPCTGSQPIICASCEAAQVSPAAIVEPPTPTVKTGGPMAPRTTDEQQRLRHALILALAVNAGATDAIGFLALGGAFTSVMTGNLVLFGISAAEGD